MTDPTAPSATTPTHWTLTLVCDDQPGIVHAVSGAVVAASGNITESQQFSSADTNTFFMRLQVMAPVDRATFEAALAPSPSATPRACSSTSSAGRCAPSCSCRRRGTV